MKFLPGPYIDISLKTSHICCLFCIELCQIVFLCEIRFMLLWSKLQTLHIYSCWLLHWKLPRNISFIHTKILHHFDMTLRVAKIIWAMQKKSRRKIYVPRSMGKKKKKRKIAHISKKKEIESCRKGCKFHPEKFHTLAHLDLIVWSIFSFGSSF